MEKTTSKMSLLVPIGFFLVFIITGVIKLFNGIAALNSLHIILPATGIVLSLVGIILIGRAYFKEIKLS